MIVSTNKYMVVPWESPVSPAVANGCMEAIEESSMRVSPKIWKRYVDDNFVSVNKDCLPEFHDKLNSIDLMTSFTMEKENNYQISFLDTLVSRNNGFIVIDVFLKPTHTGRHLDFNSHHEKKHKISTASTLLNRAYNVPNTMEGKSSEVNHVTSTLLANGYPPAVISNVSKKKKPSPELIPLPEEMVGMFFNLIENKSTTMACLPYVRRITEPLIRLLRKNGINVVTRPQKTLQQEFSSSSLPSH